MKNIRETTPYKRLLTYKYSIVINDFTRIFTKNYLRRIGSWRDKNQMDQAAGSGKQCIAEGTSQGTSLKGYLKMLGVSRGSYEELKEDYLAIARRLNIFVWQKGDRRWRRYRIYVGVNQSMPPLPPMPSSFEVFVNVMIDLITRENCLLDRQKKSLEAKHQREGGYTEKLYRRRIRAREKRK